MTLDRDAQALLSRYRDAISPDAHAGERLLGELNERIARGELPNLTAPSPPELPVGGSLATLPSVTATAKVVAGCVLVLGAGYLVREHVVPKAGDSALHGASPAPQPAAGRGMPGAARSEAPRNEARRAEAEPSHEDEPPSPAREANVEAGATPPMASSEPSPPEPRRASSSRKSATGTPRGPSTKRPPAAEVAEPLPEIALSPEPTPSGIEPEVALMREAYDALGRGEPERALAALAAHATRFPHGKLAESRRVTRIMALCLSGNEPAARAEAARFLERSPSSPFAARVRSLCAAGKTDGTR